MHYNIPKNYNSCVSFFIIKMVSRGGGRSKGKDKCLTNFLGEQKVKFIFKIIILSNLNKKIIIYF